MRTRELLLTLILLGAAGAAPGAARADRLPERAQDVVVVDSDPWVPDGSSPSGSLAAGRTSTPVGAQERPARPRAGRVEGWLRWMVRVLAGRLAGGTVR